MTRLALLFVFSLLVCHSTPLLANDLPQVQEGYRAEIAAAAPLVKHPMMACFDDRGRLFVAESAGTNRRAAELIEEPLDLIRLLEDTDGDGQFDQSSVFADRLTFPQGVLWLDGSVYTCAPPYVWKLTDTDNDGVADEREVLVESFGFNGNAASIHGPFLGPDGRLYWCDGRHGHEFFDESGTIVSKGKAARIFSCNPDGSDVRTFAGGGMDNPVEVDWLASGEMVGTVNLFYGRPRGDVLVHWIEGGVYPRFDQQDCIDEFTWTGGVLPEIHNYGHVAVSGMCRERFRSAIEDATSDAVAPDHAGSVLVTQFNTHKVIRTKLARSGSTYRAVAHEDLAIWDNPDVHPTDVLEAPDGSILIVDTGGWFRIGCPTSQIAKPEIPGAIYRIHRPHPAATSGQTESPVATAPPGPHEARLWLTVGSDAQRLAAAQQIAQVFAARRTSDTSLARHQFAPAVLSALGAGENDRHLTHALILALIRIGAADVTRDALNDKSLAVRRAALIALDQMPHGNLSEQDVIPLLETDDDELLETVLHVIGRHDGWVAETVPMFREWLQEPLRNDQRLRAMKAFFLAQADDLWVQELVADALAQKKTHPAIRQMVIDVIARADVDPIPPLWGQGLSVPLGMPSDSVSRVAAIRTIGTRGIDIFDPWLREIAANPHERPATRGEALASMAPRMETVPHGLFEFSLQQLIGEGDLVTKLTLARALAAARLDAEQLGVLGRALSTIGPAVAPILLPAFERSKESEVGMALVDGLTRLEGTLSLSPSELERLLGRYPEDVQSQAAPLIARAGAESAGRADRLEQLLGQIRPDADPSRGRSLFFGRAAGCGVCHRVGAEGGDVGPALTNIGAIREPRDLLEAIAFPSASFARDYRPYVILTNDGRVYTGVLTATTSDAVTLKTADLKDVQIRRDDIEIMRQSETSIMPAGLESKLSADELSDLIAFLQSLRGNS